MLSRQILEALAMEDFLRPFDLFYDNLAYFVAIGYILKVIWYILKVIWYILKVIWYILRLFGIF
jgi:hypothetical protein